MNPTRMRTSRSLATRRKVYPNSGVCAAETCNELTSAFDPLRTLADLVSLGL
jgi:hypothetical protein